MKKKWIEAIKEANNDSYSGSGHICQLHFAQDVIVSSRKNEIKLLDGAVPTKFFVDVIEQCDSSVEVDCNCEELIKKVSILENVILKMKLDQEKKEKKATSIINELRDKNGKFLNEIKILKRSIYDVSKTMTHYTKNVSLIVLQFSCRSIQYICSSSAV